MSSRKHWLVRGFEVGVDAATAVVGRLARLMFVVLKLTALTAAVVALVAGLIQGKLAAQIPGGLGIGIPDFGLSESEQPSEESEQQQMTFIPPTRAPLYPGIALGPMQETCFYGNGPPMPPLPRWRRAWRHGRQAHSH